ncbi:MAG: glycogen/starch/alpha-glucan phosphorylase [Clostridiales bacterium]|nr:glycogen/starch/alpha-glucan phosphorylase [Clostridiales bacterium]
MEQNFDKERFKEALSTKLASYFGVTPEEAEEAQIYKSLVLVVRDILVKKRAKFHEARKKRGGKRVYYMCMEFLIGRSLKNNLCNLGIEPIVRETLSELGFSLSAVYKKEPDPGLGNGGLGRLAACFMDSLTTLSYPATGHTICYEYGLFKQKIIDGVQVELPDDWMNDGSVWLEPRADKSCLVRFGGRVLESWENGRCKIHHVDYEEVQAIPYDLMITGAESEAVNILRLWRAHSVRTFNMSAFTQGQYVKAIEENISAETISKVLYPSDHHTEGKMLRLSQQYFLCSAALQNIIAEYLAGHGTLADFKEKIAIHLNDTHPALCIPELMRILLDMYSYSWEDAWDVCTHVFSYTNHTIMPEALEVWNEDLFKLKLPRIHQIIVEINRRYTQELWSLYPGDWDRISRMAILCGGQIRMANLSVVGSYKVNGVSKLHSELLTKTVFHDYYKKDPQQFTNVTNGIAHRRWLIYANPMLAALLDETIGPDYRKQPEKLSEFAKFANDNAVLEQLSLIKKANKERFARYVKEKTGLLLNIDSIFDVQTKRLHEYKRQLLNALQIIEAYTKLKENPTLNMLPQTYLFAAKAAPGYHMAKEIIKLIYFIASDIEKQPALREKIRVVFMEDYNVSLAEILIPAADLSEQISLAGKEASGTGNMKFMINGAVTIGTLDGANIEISEAVGPDNIYIFGLNTDEVDELWRRGYVAADCYNKSERLRRAIDALGSGFDGHTFSELFAYLLSGHGIADPYMCLADFDSYCLAHDRALTDYQNKNKWNKMALHNIANAGIFSSDRSIEEYAQKIWSLSKV